MDDDRDIPVPGLIREIQEETDRLIQIFDQYFLQSCGIAWANDLDELYEILPGSHTRATQSRVPASPSDKSAKRAPRSGFRNSA